MQHKELHAVAKSSDYTGVIHIPFELSRGCKSFALYNKGAVTVNVTVKGITIPIPAGCSSGEIKFERDWFSALTIDTELGHDFILELYRD